MKISLKKLRKPLAKEQIEAIVQKRKETILKKQQLIAEVRLERMKQREEKKKKFWLDNGLI